ncbi:MAG: hypothetical protein HWE15_04995 [Algoriphagus sp.]|uniref:hypothetical protein n=1 Tax=Algoriphagus sp. TaxID=1872435 RepID=UPI0018174CE9|nr:hypothetical protein [Algoriphagus sp.]NVJ85639.1 hypothetical protein [Algoriphagus sp.]
MYRKSYRVIGLMTVISSLLLTFFVPGLVSGLQFSNYIQKDFKETAFSTSHESNFIVNSPEELKSQANLLLSAEPEGLEQLEESFFDLDSELKMALSAIWFCLLAFSLGKDQTRFLRFCKNFFKPTSNRLHIYHCVYRI